MYLCCEVCIFYFITIKSMAKQKLPLGIQDFEELRKGNYLYVDKTDMLWKIAMATSITF